MQRQRGQNKWRHERKWISVVALVSSGFCGAAKPTWTREGAVRAAAIATWTRGVAGKQGYRRLLV